MDEIKLKPCPFCNCEELTTKFKIECDLCLSTAQHSAQWNLRPEESRLQKELEDSNSLLNSVGEWSEKWSVLDIMTATCTARQELFDILSKRKKVE